MNSIGFLYKAGFCDDVINIIYNFIPKIDDKILLNQYKELQEDVFYKPFGKKNFSVYDHSLYTRYIYNIFNITIHNIKN